MFALYLKNRNMKKTIMILAHPNLEMSIANRTISEAVNELENTEVRDLAKLYPDFNIDVEAEQQALLEADQIVFQYPIYWFNMPPILKQWFDKVFAYGFAFGTDYQLEGKEIFVSVTTGGPEEGYVGGNLESKILFPLEGIAGYCKMKYLEPSVLFAMMETPKINAAALKRKAEEQAEKITNRIQKQQLKVEEQQILVEI